MTKSPLTIVYDLDGTLANTAPDLLATLNHALTVGGYKAVDPDRIHHLVGKGARVMLGRGLEEQGITLSESEMDRLFDIFIEHYLEHMTDHDSAPYPGVMDVLQHYSQQGALQAICTNKNARGAMKLSNLVGFTPFMASITSGDLFTFKKPDGRHIIETVKMAGGDPSHAIMVGDSDNDILAAKDAGIPSVAVSFGYTAIPPAELGADAVIDHFSDLPAAVDKLVQK